MMVSRVVLVTSVVVVLYVGAGAQNLQEETRPARAEQEVLDVNRELQQATLHGDVVTLDRLFAPDLVIIGVDGRVWSKAERLEDYRSRNRVRSSERLDEPSVRIFGDTVIIGFAGWIEGVRDGREVKSRSYVSRVYQVRDGRWQLVYQQGSLLERVR